jgi:hypothetical protein
MKFGCRSRYCAPFAGDVEKRARARMIIARGYRGSGNSSATA